MLSYECNFIRSYATNEDIKLLKKHSLGKTIVRSIIFIAESNFRIYNLADCIIHALFPLLATIKSTFLRKNQQNCMNLKRITL